MNIEELKNELLKYIRLHNQAEQDLSNVKKEEANTQMAISTTNSQLKKEDPKVDYKKTIINYGGVTLLGTIAITVVAGTWMTPTIVPTAIAMCLGAGGAVTVTKIIRDMIEQEKTRKRNRVSEVELLLLDENRNKQESQKEARKKLYSDLYKYEMNIEALRKEIITHYGQGTLDEIDKEIYFGLHPQTPTEMMQPPLDRDPFRQVDIRTSYPSDKAPTFGLRRQVVTITRDNPYSGTVYPSSSGTTIDGRTR